MLMILSGHYMDFRLNRIESIANIAGVKKGVFESKEDFEKRAKREALASIAGISRGLFESEEAFERRAKLEALKKDPELVKLLGLDKK